MRTRSLPGALLAVACAAAVAWLAVALGAGCDLLFPPNSMNGDLAPAPVGDGGTVGITGRICILADVTNPTTCNAIPASAMFRVTVEETRDQTTADTTGAFSLPTAKPLTTATVAAVDALGGTYVTTVIPLASKDGIFTGVLLPVVEKRNLDSIASQNGVALDAQTGALLAYALDQTGAPRANVIPQVPVGTQAAGPLCDIGESNLLIAASATGPRGTFSFFQLRPGTLPVQLVPRTGSAAVFQLPIRGNALTIQALIF